jgi:group I intron endonuclease
MNERWNKHVGDAIRRNSDYKFHRAIRKYGVDAWNHEVLCECDSQDEAKRREIEMIAQFKSNHDEYGYNLTSGGDGCSDASDETRQKLRRVQLGRKRSEQTRIKMSRYHQNRPDTHKQRLIDSQRVYFASLSEEERNKRYEKRCKRVSMYMNDVRVQTFASVKEAASTMNCNAGLIASVARGCRKTHAGYGWKYDE